MSDCFSHARNGIIFQYDCIQLASDSIGPILLGVAIFYNFHGYINSETPMTRYILYLALFIQYLIKIVSIDNQFTFNTY